MGIYTHCDRRLLRYLIFMPDLTHLNIYENYVNVEQKLNIKFYHLTF